MIEKLRAKVKLGTVVNNDLKKIWFKEKNINILLKKSLIRIIIKKWSFYNYHEMRYKIY